MTKKYFVSISFDLCLGYVLELPYNKQYMAKLIAANVVESYQESISQQKSFITIKALNLEVVNNIIEGSPLKQYWSYEINEVFTENVDNLELIKSLSPN